MGEFANAKALVRAFHATLDAADAGEATAQALARFVAPDLLWRGMHPFNTLIGPEAVAESFWSPLKRALSPMQRRPDIFFAGRNQIDGFESVWVVEMGHLMAMWDAPWLGLAPSRKLAFLRYCEFHRIEGDRIVETAHYIDILNLLAQDARSPIADPTGLVTLTPGPLTHDGLLYGDHPEAEGRDTVELIAAMVAELRGAGVTSPDDHLERFWTHDMSWFGPGGIGASAFYHGYNRGHTHPFEEFLDFEGFTEHVTRLGEGLYGGFFGYPSLRVRSKGYLGLPGSDTAGEMRIVDLYRRDGNKLAENWIFIDFLHFYKMQGLDLIERARAAEAG
ncbi:MAG: nuclear transport factor 2 family protein [Pseudomonadota bacterium]